MAVDYITCYVIKLTLQKKNNEGLLWWGRPCHIVHPRIIPFLLFGSDLSHKDFITATVSLFYPLSFFRTTLAADDSQGEERLGHKERDQGSRDETSFIQSGELLKQAWLLDEECPNHSHTHNAQPVWLCLKVSNDNEFLGGRGWSSGSERHCGHIWSSVNVMV